MSNLEVLELTEKSIRSGISNLFWQNLLGSIFMGQFCRKIVFEGYVLNLQGLNMQTTKKTLIFDNLFFSDYGWDRYRFGAIHPLPIAPHFGMII